MCGRYGFQDPDKIRDYYDIQGDLKDLKPRYNAAPAQQLPVILRNAKLHAKIMRWGLIPFWAKDMSIGYKMINARAEGIESKPSYKKPFKTQRCLIPASCFFEWDKENGNRNPYLIRLKSQEVFSFAGLYDIWKDAEGKELLSYTIMTTESNPKIAKIHNRMPVILTKDEEKEWLDLNYPSAIKLLDPYPAEKVEMYPVSKEVNRPANDYPEIIKPLK
ncbi:hypothetical protein A3D07_02940 [Candidatus Curtissbacteria bacterium RIFCSPHIGHO2_02_FULL_42_15]|uniref:Abasic site processing protein n=1 Tax=Candidatus Curtissbacteria bacterium RIFCSPHIGHO2_02_FULL_42_15 TaxID=1797716 RepID=A0A1F5GF12_9BACT|nr:MAG: hypothetical protein A3D07_02940 [Candidatus Curtissbacteria bacterium RIFCSPHIGHO2_02_FULL_42_15]